MTTNKPASLTGNLIAVKGQAAVTAPTPIVPITPVAPAETGAYHKSLTLKVDRTRYTRLKQIGVNREQTMQDVLTAAVDLLLKQKVVS